jgi:rRNA-processing protein FCF1
MIKIILDTNFVVIPFQFHVDIYEEIARIVDEAYELVFPKICLRELARLNFGKAALQLMKKKNVKIVEIPLAKTIDDSIISYAKENGGIVATLDAELKKKARKMLVTVITLRQKKYLIKTSD